MTWLLYSQGKSPWYPLDRRLGGPQVDKVVKTKIPSPYQKLNPQPSRL